MKLYLPLVLISLLVVSSASAAVMGSLQPMPAKITGGQQGFTPRVSGGCHFETGRGIICTDLSLARQFLSRNTSNECYFDRVKGAVCPGHSKAQGVFVSDRYQDRASLMKKAPDRISTPPPALIKGDFKGPVSRRPVQSRLRIGQ